MTLFKQLFCKHNYQHLHNLMLALNDDWPCRVESVEMCDKCNKERIVSKIVGGRK